VKQPASVHLLERCQGRHRPHHDPQRVGGEQQQRPIGLHPRGGGQQNSHHADRRHQGYGDPQAGQGRGPWTPGRYRLQMIDVWLNAQRAGGNNPRHIHGGSFSGVIFLKV
jgi:hypothetical protein